MARGARGKASLQELEMACQELVPQFNNGEAINACTSVVRGSDGSSRDSDRYLRTSAQGLAPGDLDRVKRHSLQRCLIKRLLICRS